MQAPENCELCPNRRKKTPWTNYVIAAAITIGIGGHHFLIHNHERDRTPWGVYGIASCIVFSLLPVRLETESLRDGVVLLQEIKGLFVK